MKEYQHTISFPLCDDIGQYHHFSLDTPCLVWEPTGLLLSKRAAGFPELKWMEQTLAPGPGFHSFLLMLFIHADRRFEVNSLVLSP